MPETYTFYSPTMNIAGTFGTLALLAWNAWLTYRWSIIVLHPEVEPWADTRVPGVEATFAGLSVCNLTQAADNCTLVEWDNGRCTNVPGIPIRVLVLFLFAGVSQVVSMATLAVRVRRHAGFCCFMLNLCVSAVLALNAISATLLHRCLRWLRDDNEGAHLTGATMRMDILLLLFAATLVPALLNVLLFGAFELRRRCALRDYTEIADHAVPEPVALDESK